MNQRKKKTWVRAVPQVPTTGVTLRKSADGKSLEYVYAEGGEDGSMTSSRLVPGQPSLRLLRRVWVQLSASDSRTHGPRLELTLLDATHPAARRRAADLAAGGAAAAAAEGGSLREAMRARLKETRREQHHQHHQHHQQQSVAEVVAGTTTTAMDESDDDGGGGRSGTTGGDDVVRISAASATAGDDGAWGGRMMTSSFEPRRRGSGGVFKRHRINKQQRAAIETFSRIFEDLTEGFASLSIAGG